MDTVASRRRSPLRFFLLVFALSTPIWLLGAVTGAQLTADLPVSSFIWVTPVLAASMLVYRENGTPGVGRLPRRSFDYRRIRAKGWYAHPVAAAGRVCLDVWRDAPARCCR